MKKQAIRSPVPTHSNKSNGHKCFIGFRMVRVKLQKVRTAIRRKGVFVLFIVSPKKKTFQVAYKITHTMTILTVNWCDSRVFELHVFLNLCHELWQRLKSVNWSFWEKKFPLFHLLRGLVMMSTASSPYPAPC